MPLKNDLSSKNNSGQSKDVTYGLSLSLSSLILLLALCCSACMAVKPSASKTKPKLYETFYRGQEGNQYFIKPLSFKDNNGAELSMDLTFRVNPKAEQQDSAYVNMTFFEVPDRFSNGSIELNNEMASLSFENPITLFKEEGKSGLNVRFSVQLPYDGLRELLSVSN